MINHFTRAPHVEALGSVVPTAMNAALLIDFDNVTMGIRSDLSKELKTLLNSDIIKGKVTVQRAYADWRRYPQYIVPLSEASVDLIFAPAYGSSKKNATDIRMAIDGMELVFIRPEIGTFILLTGDSDFSSLVLKLKEYGKYVIGVGIQESSSDILVQNCDEYYSYSALTGLQKTSSGDQGRHADPWELVTQSMEKMSARGDVMRSDRLKQVMLELSAGFDESKYGFSKFSKFLAEAASRNLLRLRKLDNGQHEVQLPHGRGAPLSTDSPEERRQASSRRSERRSQAARRKAPDKPGREATKRSPEPKKPREESGRAAGRGRSGKGAAQTAEPGTKRRTTAGERTAEGLLADAYALLRNALRAVSPENGRVRDSDVKRRMMDLDRRFDEAQLGFSKFSKFLSKAHEDDIVRIRRDRGGNFVVRLPRQARMPSDGDSGSDASAGAPRAEPVRPPPGPLTRSRKKEREGPQKESGSEETEPKGAAEEGSRAASESPDATAPAEASDVHDAPAEKPDTSSGAEAQAPEATVSGVPAEVSAALEEGARPEDPPAVEEVSQPPAVESKTRDAAPASPASSASGADHGAPPEALAEALAAPKTSRVEGTISEVLAEEEGPNDASTPQPAGDEAPERARAKPESPDASPKPKAPGGDEVPVAPKPRSRTSDSACRRTRPRGSRSAEPETPAAKDKGRKGSRPGSKGKRTKAKSAPAARFSPARMGLPTEPEAVKRYLQNRYRGVGKKTAERLVEAFGKRVFQVLHNSASRVGDVLPKARAAKVLEAWQDDYARRSASPSEPASSKRASGRTKRKKPSTTAGKSSAPSRRSRLRPRRGSS